MRKGEGFGLWAKVWLGVGLLLGVAACSIPFSYEVDVLQSANLSGTFAVGQGGINPNPTTVGPLEITYPPDPRVTLSAARLDYQVCFASQTPGASFSGNLTYTAYLGGNSGALFQEANKLAEGSKDVSALSAEEVCLEGQAPATPAQVQALQSGTFYVGARISGNATSAQAATIRYETRRFILRLSGTVRP